jgi:hypothetical protein
MRPTQYEAALAAMTAWLSHPQELGHEPAEIECTGTFVLHDMTYYIFKYKDTKDSEWLLGVNGGYEGDSLSDCGHTFSEMEPYDRNNWYAFATLYGGIQQADIKTDDGIKSDTDGVEFGASLEAGYDYNLTDTVYLTPSLGVFYTQVNYDDATDSVGKKAEYNDLKQIELEAGVKLTKAFRLDEGYANVYVKPSVVQTIVDGDEVNITGLGKVNTLDDETLGRIEFGGRYGFTDQLTPYG